MKAYKRLTLFLFFSFLAVTLWRVFIPLNDANHRNWTTYSREEGKIKAGPTTEAQAQKLKLPTPKEAGPRTPASLSPLHSPIEITGEGIEEFHANKASFRFLNRVNPDWKEKMASRLMRFQDEQTKLYAKHEKSIIHLENDTAKYLEQVVLNFSLHDGVQYSYRALVNAEDGKVIETWDRTKYDTPYRFKRHQGAFTPTGSL